MLRRVKGIVKKSAVKVNNKLTVLAEKTQTGKKAEMSVSDVFFMQFDKQELRRYDIVVRYLAIEQYYGKNDFGFELYRKMQNARIRDGYGDGSTEQFRRLIKSYEERGYDDGSCIVVDKALSLIDGSHRIALHLYFGLESIRVLILPTKKPVDYTVDWFFQKGFTDDEIDLILAKSRELTEKADIGFSCVIWSPAVGLSEALLKDMAYFGQIRDVKRYAYQPAEYRNLVNAIYRADDIADWKVQRKLEHMQQENPELLSVHYSPIFPDFRIKGVSGMPLSRRGERMKKALRGRFMAQVENYIPDIILHMADNYQQSIYMFRVLEPNIDMLSVLNALEPYSYALTKTDVPYCPADFPHHIPVGRDADILCTPQDFPGVIRSLLAIAEGYPMYEVRVIEKSHSTHIRLEKMGKLIYLLDVSWQMDGLADDFVEEALAHRERHGEYMRLSAAYEYICRVVSYRKNEAKTHHRVYLQTHMADLDVRLLERYAGMTAQELDALLARGSGQE